MYTYELIPFILVLNVYIKDDLPITFPKEYVFSFNNTVVRQRETLEHVQTTGKLTCQNPFLDYPVLRCFLQNVRYISPDYVVEYEKLNNIVQIGKDDTKFNHTFWFEININKHGAQYINVEEDYKKIVKVDNIDREIIINIIKDIGHLFKIDSDKIGKNLNMQSGSSVFTSTETSTMGNCRIKYNMTVTFNKKNDKRQDMLQIIPRVLSKISLKEENMYRYSYVQIEKNGKSCYYWSLLTDNDYSEPLVTKHNYKMEMLKDKLKISNTISVRRPFSPENPLVVEKTTLLNLTDINYQQSEQLFDWDNPSGWIAI